MKTAALEEIHGHLGAALMQTLPDRDDQIIMDHVRAAYYLARSAMREQNRQDWDNRRKVVEPFPVDGWS